MRPSEWFSYISRMFQPSLPKLERGEIRRTEELALQEESMDNAEFAGHLRGRYGAGDWASDLIEYEVDFRGVTRLSGGASGVLDRGSVVEELSAEDRASLSVWEGEGGAPAARA